MAADEVLLESAAESGRASLRFYEWSEPTLSLGYFQSASVRETDAKLQKLPWVRRATGGAALVHDREITYALALPPGRPWQRPGLSLVCRVHDAIARAFADWKVRLDTVPYGGEKKIGDVLCFLHQTPGDLLLAGQKVVGSAQRKQKGAILQHGGILLAKSDFTPQLPGIQDLSGVTIPVEKIAAAVAQQLATTAGWALFADDWTAQERTRIPVILEEKYLRSEWNAKR